VQPPLAQPEAQPLTIVQVAPAEPAREIGMIDVALAGFGVTGVIMAAALMTGILAGAGYIWYRSRRAVSTMEERGHTSNLFRA